MYIVRITFLDLCSVKKFDEHTIMNTSINTLLYCLYNVILYVIIDNVYLFLESYVWIFQKKNFVVFIFAYKFVKRLYQRIT